MLTEEDLFGAWRLVSHHYLNADGSTSEGPLGSNADGLLIYDPQGYVAAALMRTDGATAAGPGQGPPPEQYLGYSGSWRLRDGVVVHTVAVSSHPGVVNTEQVREVRFEDGRLVLRKRLDDASRHVAMSWRRASPPATA